MPPIICCSCLRMPWTDSFANCGNVLATCGAAARAAEFKSHTRSNNSIDYRQRDSSDLRLESQRIFRPQREPGIPTAPRLKSCDGRFTNLESSLKLAGPDGECPY